MKPQPVVVTTICSMCGEPWEAHGEKPSTEDCVRLLRAKVTALQAQRPIIINQPPYPPFIPVRPAPWWSQPYTITCGSNTSQISDNVARTEYRQPAITATCSAVPA